MYHRAVLMLVWAVSQKVKPPPSVRTDTQLAPAKLEKLILVKLTNLSFFLLVSSLQMCPLSPM